VAQEAVVPAEAGIHWLPELGDSCRSLPLRYVFL